jgi:hypothetical protein
MSVADVARAARVAEKTVRNWLTEKWLIGYCPVAGTRMAEQVSGAFKKSVTPTSSIVA